MGGGGGWAEPESCPLSLSSSLPPLAHAGWSCSHRAPSPPPTHTHAVWPSHGRLVLQLDLQSATCQAGLLGGGHTVKAGTHQCAGKGELAGVAVLSKHAPINVRVRGGLRDGCTVKAGTHQCAGKGGLAGMAVLSKQAPISVRVRGACGDGRTVKAGAHQCAGKGGLRGWPYCQSRHPSVCG